MDSTVNGPSTSGSLADSTTRSLDDPQLPALPDITHPSARADTMPSDGPSIHQPSLEDPQPTFPITSLAFAHDHHVPSTNNSSGAAADIHTASLYWTEGRDSYQIGDEDMPAEQLKAELLKLLRAKANKGPNAQNASIRMSRGEQVSPPSEISDMILPVGTSISIVRTYDRKGKVVKWDVPLEWCIERVAHHKNPGRPPPINLHHDPHSRFTCQQSIMDRVILQSGRLPALDVSRSDLVHAWRMADILTSPRPPMASAAFLSMTIRSPNGDGNDALRTLCETHHQSLHSVLKKAWEDTQSWWKPPTAAGGTSTIGTTRSTEPQLHPVANDSDTINR